MSIDRRFWHLVDDAAIFPPGCAALPDAVRDHVAHLAADHADLVGPFVVDVARWAELSSLAPAGLRTSVVVPAPSDLPVVLARAAAGSLRLVAVEVALAPGAPPAEQVAEVAAAVPPGVTAFIEAPRPGDPGWPAVSAAVVAHGLRLKFRTGGTVAAAFPTEAEVARWIVDAVQAGAPFKCTAGLHNAVRHTDPTTGFEHHGYLNVLVATARALAGAGTDAVTEVIGRRDAPSLAVDVRSLTDAEVAATRAAFLSYGSCSIAEPLEDLTDLTLLDAG